VALARPPSHCNMNINIRSAAGSQSQHRGTGESPRSTSQHLPDCSPELWRTYSCGKRPQPAQAQLAKASGAGLFCHRQMSHPPPKAGRLPADLRWPSPSPEFKHRWLVQEREPLGRGPKASSVTKPWQIMLIFIPLRTADRPQPNPSNTHEGSLQ
jgi:hypothetical protein